MNRLLDFIEDNWLWMLLFAPMLIVPMIKAFKNEPDFKSDKCKQVYFRCVEEGLTNEQCKAKSELCEMKKKKDDEFNED